MTALAHRHPPFKATFALVGMLLACFGLTAVTTGQEPAAEAAGEILHLKLDSVIHPVASEFLKHGLAEADERGAALLVVELNTPGGAMSLTRELTTAIVNAKTPVVVFVSPRGAHAASAGFFLLMASDVAAMAPETSTGAAAAVGAQGEDLPETMKAKVEQDSIASIRAFAERSRRNVPLAESAIREARSFSASEAHQGGLVEVVAPHLDGLIAALEGRTVSKGGTEHRLELAGRPRRELEMSFFERFLAVLASPDIAFLLLGLGSLCIMVEIYNPGAIFPAVVGAICLVLGFWGVSVLPVNSAAIALIFLALVFFIAEIKVVSYGLLTVAGVVCLALAGMMLIRDPDPGFNVSWGAIIGLALSALGVTGLLSVLASRALKNKVTTGSEGLLGARGEATTALTPKGKVFLKGELWNAVASTPIAAGAAIEVTAVNGLTLSVRAADGAALDHTAGP